MKTIFFLLKSLAEFILSQTMRFFAEPVLSKILQSLLQNDMAKGSLFYSMFLKQTNEIAVLPFILKFFQSLPCLAVIGVDFKNTIQLFYRLFNAIRLPVHMRQVK